MRWLQLGFGSPLSHRRYTDPSVWSRAEDLRRASLDHDAFQDPREEFKFHRTKVLAADDPEVEKIRITQAQYPFLITLDCPVHGCQRLYVPLNCRDSVDTPYRCCAATQVMEPRAQAESCEYNLQAMTEDLEDFDDKAFICYLVGRLDLGVLTPEEGFGPPVFARNHKSSLASFCT